MPTTRYSAGIQRAKGLMEMAAALYDSSLSYQTRRAAEGMLQTDTRVGRVVRLSLDRRANERNDDISVSFATGSFREIIAVANKKYSMAWVNPSVLLTMACRGKGPFRVPRPLCAIAVFPSWDVMGFAVHESTGIVSLEQIAEEKFPLRVSTGRIPKDELGASATMFTVSAVLKAAGFSLAQLRNWGGKIHSAPRPSDPSRRAAIESGEVNAIFDEGIKSWGQTALDRGFRYLPVQGKVLKDLTRLGYRPAQLSKARFKRLNHPVQTLDFSGWPMIVHSDMADEVAYALCEAIEKRRAVFPTDNYRPLDIAQLCANDDEAPLDAPLHPGAKRFYRERGFLK
jgi:NMT1-like family